MPTASETVMSRSPKKESDQFSQKEAQERFEKALRGGLKTSPKPLKNKAKKKPPSPAAGKGRSRKSTQS
jgi:hypothetical protein